MVRKMCEAAGGRLGEAVLVSRKTFVAPGEKRVLFSAPAGAGSLAAL